MEGNLSQNDLLAQALDTVVAELEDLCAKAFAASGAASFPSGAQLFICSHSAAVPQPDLFDFERSEKPVSTSPVADARPL